MSVEKRSNISDSRTTESNDDERRRAPRAPLEVPVVVHNHHPHRGLLANLSRSGAFIHMTHPVDVGELVEVEFSAPDGHKKLRVLGEVRWKHGEDDASGGVGIAFRNLGADGLEHLRSFVTDLDLTA